jgi:N-acyl-D-aspartate/D-glutamate deacylase
MPEVVRRISAARQEGLDIVADLYPYVWGHAGLIALLPPWARIGTREDVVERLSDNTNRERIKKELVTPTTAWENEYHGVGSPKEIVVVDVRGTEKIKHLQGMSLAEIGSEQGKDPRDVLMDIVKMGGAGFISHITDEDDLRLALVQEWTAFGTDGEVAAPDGPLSSGLPHPRGYGTFPKILGRYVREWKVLSLEEAIRKSTSLTAQRLGIRERGLLREGFYADVVVFDPETIIDKATYENPHQYSEGIDYVLVNGEVVVDHGRITDARPGMVVRGPGYSREN